MIELLIQLVIVLLIAGLVWWIIEQLLPLVPMPGPIARVIRVLVIAIIALIVIYYALIPLLHEIPRVR
jgi:hypothetical protein